MRIRSHWLQKKYLITIVIIIVFIGTTYAALVFNHTFPSVTLGQVFLSACGNGSLVALNVNATYPKNGTAANILFGCFGTYPPNPYALTITIIGSRVVPATPTFTLPPHYSSLSIANTTDGTTISGISYPLTSGTPINLAPVSYLYVARYDGTLVGSGSLSTFTVSWSVPA